MVEKKKVILPVAAAIGIGMIAWGLTKAKAGPPVPGLEDFILSDLRVRSPVAVGRTVWVNFDVENPNDIEFTGTITMTSPWEESTTITLGPGEKTFLAAFPLVFDAPGEYLIKVGDLKATVVVMEILPVFVDNLKASPEVVTVGEAVDITVDVSNENWEETVVYLVQLTGAVQAEQEVTLAPHEVRKVLFVEIVTWEGYQTVYCEDLSVLIKGEMVYPGPPPPGAYICPICQWEGDSDSEVGRHAAEAHYGYTYPAGTINEGSFGGMGGSLVLYDIIDPNPTLLARAHWAMGNIVSGENLWKNLSASQRDSLRSYLIEVLGMTSREIDALFRSYGAAYWQAYIRIDEIAPGWSEWLLPPGEEAPPAEAVLKHRFSAWYADRPLPDCFLGISTWEISDPEPYQSESGQWYITIHAYYYVWSDTGELVYPCS